MNANAKQGFEIEVGDNVEAGQVVAVGFLEVWYGVLIKVNVDNNPRPVYFAPQESVAIKCCNGASRDCLVHGDGN